MAATEFALALADLGDGVVEINVFVHDAVKCVHHGLIGGTMWQTYGKKLPNANCDKRCLSAHGYGAGQAKPDGQPQERKSTQ